MRAIIALAMLLAATGSARAAEINVMLTDALWTSFKSWRRSLPARTATPFMRCTVHPVDWCGGSTPESPPMSSSSTTAASTNPSDKASSSLAAPTSRAPASALRCARAHRKPDISTPDALKRALLDARSIGYTDPAGGGLTAAPIIAMIEEFGISVQIAAKTKLAAGGPTGRVSTLIANGEAEIGMQMVSELL